MSKTYIQTFTGKHFYPFDPNPDDICIEDVAHALAHQCRFTGHCKSFYSVAQHSIIVSNLVSGKEDRRWGLLHDASEAYLTDVARPVKHSPAFAEYRKAEALVMKAVCKKFGLEGMMPSTVHAADNIALASEAYCLMGDVSSWGLSEDDMKRVAVYPIAPDRAEAAFLSLYWSLA